MESAREEECDECACCEEECGSLELLGYDHRALESGQGWGWRCARGGQDEPGGFGAGRWKCDGSIGVRSWKCEALGASWLDFIARYGLKMS